MNRRNLLKSLLLAPLAPLVGKIAVAEASQPGIAYLRGHVNKWVIACAGHTGSPLRTIWRETPGWLPMPKWAAEVEYPDGVKFNSPLWWPGRWTVLSDSTHVGSFFEWAEVKEALRRAFIDNERATVLDRKSGTIACIPRHAFHQLSQRRLAETRT